MKKVTIYLDDEEVKVLSKRAKKNLFTLKEQIEDILRKSVVRTKTLSKYYQIKVDDRLVGVFSRQKEGGKPKRKVRNRKKLFWIPSCTSDYQMNTSEVRSINCWTINSPS